MQHKSEFKESSTHPTRFLRAIGGILTLLGAAVLVGWFLRSPTLVQGLPDMVPMQPNTALCFLLCGLGMMAMTTRYSEFRIGFGLIVSILGLLTLGEYGFASDFGIDRLIVEPFTTVKTSDPGRMSPLTAFCFLLAGLALVQARRNHQSDLHHMTLAVFSSIIASIGASVLFGYVVGLGEVHGWPIRFTQMAFHTAAAFLLFGAGILRFVWNLSRQSTRALPRWLPVPIAFGTLAATFVTHLMIRSDQSSRVERSVRAESETLQKIIEGTIRARIHALVQMARRLEARSETPQSEWERDAAQYLEHLAGFQAIQWVSPSFRVRWMVPLAGNESVLNRNLGFDEKRLAALTKARDSRSVTISRTIQLIQGGRGFLVYAPIYRDNTFDGLVTGVFRTEPLLKAVLPKVSESEFVLKLFDDETEIYSSPVPSVGVASQFERSTVLHLQDVSWQMRLSPSVDLHQSWADEATLFVGALLSLLLSGCVYLAQTSQRRASELAKSNDLLASEIAERQRVLQDLAKARDGALESARLKSEFLANMSHEIRTPMHGVIGTADLLLDTELTAEQRDYATTISKSADALLTVINDILDFSKIEAGKLTFETIDFDLRELIEETIEIFALQAHVKRIQLASLVYGDTPTQLRGDPGRLRQVIANLISNAVKFTDRGEIVLRATADRQSEMHVDIRIAVTDTGIGIAPEVQERLFQSFTQADGSTTRQYGGTGLGLAISKELVKRMGGEIGVESTVSRGSTFWFTCHLEKQPASAVPSSPIVADSPAVQVLGVDDHPVKLRILLVEDSRVNQKLASAQLGQLGFRADIASNGLEALSIFERKLYDVILMDCQMPQMDGYETTQKIRAADRALPPYIIAITANAMLGDREKCLAAGMNDYLSKPLKTSDLKAALDRAVLALDREHRSENDPNQLAMAKTSPV